MGFGEAGLAGKMRQAELESISQESRMPILGPNCEGYVDFQRRTPCFLEPLGSYEAGHVALISQSGGVADALVNNRRGVRWGPVVATGNEACVDAADVLWDLVGQDSVHCICLFLEAIRRPCEFFEACERARLLRKPVIVLKSGTSEAAQRAAESHTDALAAPDDLIASRMRRHAVIRVASAEEMLQTALALGVGVLPSTRGVGIVAGSGGEIQLMLDALERQGLSCPPLSEESTSSLRPMLPPFLSANNPIDYWGIDNLAESLPKMVEVLASDKSVGTVFALTDVRSSPIDVVGDFAHAIRGVAPAAAKMPETLFAAVGPLPDSFQSEEAQSAVEAGVAPLANYSTAAKIVSNIISYREQLVRLPENSVPKSSMVDLNHKMRATSFSGLPAIELIAAIGVPVANTRLATNGSMAASIAEDLGFPVVVKAGEATLIHKAESRAVHLNISTFEDVEKACQELAAQGLQQYLVQKQVRGSIELIAGLKTHDELGTFLMIGVGGTWAEVYQDISVRPVGLNDDEIHEMLRDLRAWPVLNGARGVDPVDLDGVVGAIRALDQYGRQCGRLLDSLDINPIVATSAGIFAVDAVVVPKACVAVSNRGGR